MKTDSQKQAYNFTLKLIAVHPRTVLEIKNKLEGKGLSLEIANQVIALLKDQGYLNDGNYARAWLEERIRNRPSGRALCWKKLKDKGIDRDIIDKVLDELLGEKKELELALKLAKNKKAQLKAREVHWKKIPGKVGFFLQSRGFPTSIIMEAIEQL